ncbi:MAG: hypothetical protein CEE38_09080 [Planctomycetes bacterium B3_Pla]|nr:MAG: hypothetical protein CEE38_09080 [Planctomycetes bacterium B3_Pla]
MENSRGIILVLTIAVVITVAALPCPADEKKEEEKSIFAEDEQRGSRSRRGRIELTDEEIGRILQTVRKSDPEKAKEIAKLREKDPQEFRSELRRHGEAEYDKIIREHIDRWRQQRLEDFLNWLKKNYRRKHRELMSLKERDPDLYDKRLDSLRRKLDPIREAERRNPELAEILKEDLQLKERRDELIVKIRAAKTEGDKKGLVAQLEKVLGDRYDLILKKKQTEYERLLRWVETLQNRIKKSRAEIAEAKKKEVKAENVKKRKSELLEGKKDFNWK